jgi:hypothetical protein
MVAELKSCALITHSITIMNTIYCNSKLFSSRPSVRRKQYLFLFGDLSTISEEI